VRRCRADSTYGGWASQRKSTAIATGTVVLAALATLALIALGVATASASDGTFDRTWGWGVQDGTAEFQICTSACQVGISGDGNGQFDTPAGVATDPAGNVYVADIPSTASGSNRIQKFDSDGNFIAKWGSTGTGDGQFNLPAGVPAGVATDRAGSLYVADAGNHRIQKFGGGAAILGLSVEPTIRMVKRGKGATFTGTVENTGDADGSAVKVCVKAPKAIKVRKCVNLGAVQAGGSEPAKFKATAKANAKPKLYRLKFTATGSGVDPASDRAFLNVKKG
jgi:hypothetical protein